MKLIIASVTFTCLAPSVIHTRTILEYFLQFGNRFSSQQQEISSLVQLHGRPQVVDNPCCWSAVCHQLPLYHGRVQSLWSPKIAVILISCDFSKAFDKVHHDSLINNFSFLPCNILQSTVSYLKDRYSKDRRDSFVSSSVLQSSVIGHYIFGASIVLIHIMTVLKYMYRFLNIQMTSILFKVPLLRINQTNYSWFVCLCKRLVQFKPHSSESQ